MELGKSYTEETQGAHRDVGTRLGTPGSPKALLSRKSVEENGEEEALEVAKTRSQSKGIVGRIRWQYAALHTSEMVVTVTYCFRIRLLLLRKIQNPIRYRAV
jgi:hypothetical protein